MRRAAWLGWILILPASVLARGPVEEKVTERVRMDEPQVEDPLHLPSLPGPSHLVELESLHDRPRYRYFIDTESYTIGRDRIARFSVLLRSDAGTDNFLYEGIRCADRSYKTYAFGVPGKGFRARTSAAWMKPERSALLDYRWALARHLVCDETGRPVSRRELGRRLRAWPRD